MLVTLGFSRLTKSRCNLCNEIVNDVWPYVVFAPHMWTQLATSRLTTAVMRPSIRAYGGHARASRRARRRSRTCRGCWNTCAICTSTRGTERSWPCMNGPGEWVWLSLFESFRFDPIRWSCTFSSFPLYYSTVILNYVAKFWKTGWGILWKNE